MESCDFFKDIQLSSRIYQHLIDFVILNALEVGWYTSPLVSGPSLSYSFLYVDLNEKSLDSSAVKTY